MGGGSGERLSSPRLIGRDGELAVLADVTGAPPAVVVIEGEAGVGKTRLIKELRQRVRGSSDRLFLVGSCRLIREPFPLGAVLEALRQLERTLHVDVWRELSPVAGALRPLLPELSAVLPPTPERLGDRAAERHRVFRALVEVLQAIGPAELVLEDVHWADEHTLDFVDYVLAAMPPKLSVTLTLRGEGEVSRVRAIVAKLPTTVHGVRLELEPLAAATTGELAAAILGVERVSDEFARYLCERSSGVPFAVEELLALLRAQGALVRRSGSWSRRSLEELDVPAGIRDPVLERLGRVPEPGRSVVEAAAVLQAPVPIPVLVATCRDSDVARQGLEQALESGLLTEVGPDVGFRHLLAAQAVYESVPSPRRQELHDKAADALRSVDPVPLGQVAHHLRNAGRELEWVRAAEAAADQAIELRNDEEAARLLDEVLRYAAVSTDERGRLAVKLGIAAARALHCREDVVELLWQALEVDLPPAVRGELCLRWAVLVDRFGGDLHLQRVVLAEAVDHLTESPDLMGYAMVGLALPRSPNVPLSDYQRWQSRILELLPRIEDHEFRVAMRGKVTMAQICTGDPQWRDQIGLDPARVRGIALDPVEAGAYHSVGFAACCAGHSEVADQLLAAGLDGATRNGNRQQEFWLQATVALLDYCRGAWAGLADRAQVLVEQLTDLPLGRIHAEVVAGCLAVAHGETDRASMWLAGPIEWLQRNLLSPDLIAIPASAMIRLAMGVGDSDSAVDRARRLVIAVESVPLPVAAIRALPAVTEALTAVGELAEARLTVARWQRRLRRRDAPLVPAALPYARGVLAAATQDHPTAARRCGEAAREYERLGCRYEAAQARERAGAALLDAGDQQAGAVELRTALATFDGLGAVWDHSRAAGTARRHGIRVPTSHRGGRRGYGAELSPRERQVAQLVARGRTNREIAAELFISVRTVERHVTVALQKLEATSRVALARRLDDGSGRPHEQL